MERGQAVPQTLVLSMSRSIMCVLEPQVLSGIGALTRLRHEEPYIVTPRSAPTLMQGEQRTHLQRWCNLHSQRHHDFKLGMHAFLRSASFSSAPAARLMSRANGTTSVIDSKPWS
jgi:hypothetical protein